MKWYSFIIILVIVITVIVVFPSDKKRIRKIIGQCEQSVVGEDLKSLMGHISFNYSDDYGGSYMMLKKRAEGLFKSYDDFEIASDIKGINITEEKAVADLRVSLIASAGNERGYLLGDAGGHRKLRVYLEKSPYGWQVIRLAGLSEKEQDLQLY